MAARTKTDPLHLISGAEGIITGTVICGAVIAAGAHADTVAELMEAIIGTVLVYWLAHVFASTLGGALQGAQDPWTAFRRALVHNVPLALASLLPVVALLVAEFAGADIYTAATIALIATTALLTGYSYLAGRRVGWSQSASVLAGLGGTLLGVLTIVLKTTLH